MKEVQKTEESQTDQLRVKLELKYAAGADKDKAISAGRASSLIDKADGDPVKLQALKATLVARYETARKQATMWRNKLKAESGKKWDTKTRDKAKVATYFKTEPWAAYEQALEDGNFVNVDGVSRLEVGNVPTAAPVRIAPRSGPSAF